MTTQLSWRGSRLKNVLVYGGSEVLVFAVLGHAPFLSSLPEMLSAAQPYQAIASQHPSGAFRELSAYKKPARLSCKSVAFLYPLGRAICMGRNVGTQGGQDIEDWKPV
jgi:hypothetical protein